MSRFWEHLGASDEIDLPDDPNRLNRAPQYSELNSNCLGGAFTTRCVGTNSVSAEAKRNNVFALQFVPFRRNRCTALGA